jgi:hypothetical protein
MPVGKKIKALSKTFAIIGLQMDVDSNKKPHQ